MPPKSKRFISKDQGRKFRVVYESSEFQGPQAVLQEVSRGSLGKPSDYMSDDGSSPFRSAGDDGNFSATSSRQSRAYNLELGFPDDGYDYTQHLRAISHEAGGVFVPASFTAEEEEELSAIGRSGSSGRKRHSSSFGVRRIINAKRVRVARVVDEDPTASAEGDRLGLLQEPDLERMFENVEYIPDDGGDAGSTRQSKKAVHFPDGAVRKKHSGALVDAEIEDILENDEEIPVEEGDGSDSALEDDFMVKATGGEAADFAADDGAGLGLPVKARSSVVRDADGDIFDDEDDEDYDDDDDDEYDEYDDDDDDAAIVGQKRHGNAKHLDDALNTDFDKILELYRDEEIGDLDPEDPRNSGKADISSYAASFGKLLDDVTRMDRKHKVKMDVTIAASAASAGMVAKEEQDRLKQVILAMAAASAEADESGLPPADEQETVVLQARDRWDCETIVSTYSNLENHPKVISEQEERKERPGKSRQIKLSSKTGIPLGYVHGQPDGDSSRGPAAGGDSARGTLAAGADASDTAADDGQEDEDEDEPAAKANLGMGRSKEETAVEKQGRKKQLKEEKRASRERKKTMKVLYKKEEERQHHLSVKNPTMGLRQVPL